MLAEIACNKKASDIIIMDLTDIEFAPSDFFVICSCDSDSQIDAIVNETRRYCNEFEFDYPKFEGIQNSYWVIADFFDAVFHIMHRDARIYYQIERIWADAKFYRVKENGDFEPLNDFDYFKNLE